MGRVVLTLISITHFWCNMDASDKTNIRPVCQSWLDQGGGFHSYVLNPPNNFIMNDTGQLSAGYYDFMVVGVGDANHSFFSIEHRNAANTANVRNYPISVCAFMTSVVYILGHFVSGNERVRIRSVGVGAGSFCVQATWHKRHDL